MGNRTWAWYLSVVCLCFAALSFVAVVIYTVKQGDAKHEAGLGFGRFGMKGGAAPVLEPPGIEGAPAPKPSPPPLPPKPNLANALYNTGQELQQAQQQLQQYQQPQIIYGPPKVYDAEKAKSKQNIAARACSAFLLAGLAFAFAYEQDITGWEPSFIYKIIYTSFLVILSAVIYVMVYGKLKVILLSIIGFSLAFITAQVLTVEEPTC